MITLFYIKGISRYDTPLFNSNIDQDNFFFEHIVISIENSYYPPHYKNKIRITYEDLDITKTSVNYLSLSYNGKYYYYFIDSVNYINDSVYELEITMDMIQTYMFNINIKDCTIERKLIKRFNSDGTFNRDYTRENLYNGIKKIDRTLLSSGKYWLLITSGSKLGLDNGDKNVVCKINNLDGRLNYSSGLYYYLYPLYGTKITGLFKAGLVYTESTYEVNYEVSYEMFNQIVQDANIIEIKIIDSIFLENYYNKDSNTYVFNDMILTSYLTPLDTNTFMINLTTDELLTKFTYLGMTFNKVSNTTTTFNYKNIPFIFDDNYIEFNYGEPISKTNISLQLLTDSKLNCRAYYDITTGGRGYQILNSNSEDVQETTKIVNSKEELGLITDAWNEYYSRNKSSATIGYATNLVNNALKFKLSEQVGSPMGMINAMGSVVKEYTKYSDIHNTPDTQKTANAMNLDTKMYNLLINYEWVKYSDNELNAIARQVETRGYLVNEKITNNNNCITLLTQQETRYYFNIIKTSNIDLYLVNIISDNETIEKIKERFNNGFRYWNYKRLEDNLNMTELLKYDNVELDNLV